MTREVALEVIKSHPFLFASFPDDVIEALDVLIRQEPIIDKIRAEIEEYQKDAFYSNDVRMSKKMVLAIIDKYEAEIKTVANPEEAEAHPMNENIAKGFEEFTKMMFRQGEGQNVIPHIRANKSR